VRKLGKYTHSLIYKHFEREVDRESEPRRVRRRSRERKLGLELWSKIEARILILEGKGDSALS